MKQRAGYFIALCALVAAMGMGCLMTGCTSTDAEGDAQTEAVSEVSSGESVPGDKAAAEALIGQSLTREEIEAAVGSGERFEMNSAGCERGVYGGYFYYDDFTIFSRTYDKGGTFTVVSVDE